VLAVAGRALRTPEHPDEPGQVAVSRVLSRSGTWVVLHGASLVPGGARRVAVIVEPAHPARIAPLLMSAYGLTEREQDVTRLVLQGNSTTEIAERLVVSAHTVQQHLKSVFDKTGVHSRRDLVGKVFFAHYEPRLRDNERRATQDQPLRGGPSPVAPADRTLAVSGGPPLAAELHHPATRSSPPAASWRSRGLWPAWPAPGPGHAGWLAGAGRRSRRGPHRPAGGSKTAPPPATARTRSARPAVRGP
jgi:DNA-binding CsgD family transcriptional regulator